MSNSVNNLNTIMKCALDKLNKIWLKGLNSRILKDEGLNWSKVLMRDEFQISLKLEGPKTYLTLVLFIYPNVVGDSI